jgi:hypothetical protein
MCSWMENDVNFNFIHHAHIQVHICWASKFYSNEVIHAGEVILFVLKLYEQKIALLQIMGLVH